MKKDYYKVLGIRYSKLAKFNSIEEAKAFDMIGAAVESLTDALNLRKQMFRDYPQCYFTVRKYSAEDCPVIVSPEEVDAIINETFVL